MPSPELPVIYENPRFDAATPTLKPVFDRALRFGMVLMVEWGTLTLIEDSPRYLKFATVVVAVLGLAVHESWPWLHMRNRLIYPITMAVLAATFVGICGYAFWTEPSKRSATTEPPASPLLIRPLEQQMQRQMMAYGERMSADDKARLRGVVFELTGKLNRGMELYNEASKVVAAGYQEPQSVANDLEGWMAKTDTVLKNIREFQMEMSKYNTGQYFGQQVTYVLNPLQGASSFADAVESYGAYLNIIRDSKAERRLGLVQWPSKKTIADIEPFFRRLQEAQGNLSIVQASAGQ